MAKPGDRLDIGAIQWEKTPEERKREADTRAAEAGLPYIKPKGDIDVASGQEALVQRKYERADKMRADFEGHPDYKRYAVAVPALEAALTTTDDTMGDLALTYYAAKLFDPDSAVREGEQETMKTAEATLARVQEKIKKEFGFDGATFTDEGRVRLRQQLIRRTASLNKSFNRIRTQYSTLAQKRGYDPDDIVGEHLGTPFLPAAKAYDEQRRAAGAKVGPVGLAETAATGAAPPKTTADVFAGPPEGATIAGEPVEGFRFTPDAEAEIVSYVRGPDFTPEGYGSLLTQKALESGFLKQEQAADYAARAADKAREMYEGLSPETRAAVPGYVDYSEIDKAATESAGLGASVAQGLRNIPESAAQLAEGLVALPGSAVASVAAGEPVGATRVVTELASEMGEGPTTDAALAALRERYGNLKQTAITDPVGILGDVSLGLTGAGAGARAAGMSGRVSEGLSRAGTLLDPVSAITSAGERATRVARPFGVAASEIAGLPSGVGGPALREAAAAGYERGAGPATARSAALTRGMRDADNVGEDVVRAAQDAVRAIRDKASADYTAAMQQFGQSPAPLPIANVVTRLQKLKPRNYDAMADAPRRPSDHVAWEQMMATVQDYAVKAAQNPSLLEPLSMDAFKQDLYSIGSKIGDQYDRDAARIAGTAYNAVKDELVKHDPLYAKTMKDYERAAREAQQIEGSFGLAAARGKQPNVDSAMRRLQSIYRNNANTNYGQRAAQGERIAELDATGTIMPTLAGQQLSAWAPRGIQRGVTPSAAFGVSLVNPGAAAGLLGLSSPRLMGEVAYGAGRAAGAGRDTLAALSKAYETAPARYLGAAQVGSRLEEADREELARRYGMIEPPAFDPLFYSGEQ